MEILNFYCDESGHLPLYHPDNDIQKNIVLGTVYCSQILEMGLYLTTNLSVHIR